MAALAIPTRKVKLALSEAKKSPVKRRLLFRPPCFPLLNGATLRFFGNFAIRCDSGRRTAYGTEVERKTAYGRISA